MVLSFLLDLASSVIGFFMPAYMNFKEINHKPQRKQNQVVQVNFNKYWTVYALYTVADNVAHTLYLHCLPGYTLLKLGFLFWASPSCMNGSTKLYDHVISPFVIKHEREIDSLTGRLLKYGFYSAKAAIGAVASRAVMSLSSPSMATASAVNVVHAALQLQSAQNDELVSPEYQSADQYQVYPRAYPVVTNTAIIKEERANVEDCDGDEEANEVDDVVPLTHKEARIRGQVARQRREARERTLMDRSASIFDRSVNLAEDSCNENDSGEEFDASFVHVEQPKKGYSSRTAVSRGSVQSARAERRARARPASGSGVAPSSRNASPAVGLPQGVSPSVSAIYPTRMTRSRAAQMARENTPLTEA